MTYEMWRDSGDPQSRDERTTNMMYAYEQGSYRLQQMKEEYEALATAFENATHLIIDDEEKKRNTAILNMLEARVIGLEDNVDALKSVLEGKGIDVA